VGALGQRQLPRVRVSALKHTGIAEFRQALLEAAPADFIDNPSILADLVGTGEMAVLVVPIDKEAPRGRLILPQVQAIRDLLDNDALCLVVKERELRSALERLKSRSPAGGDRFAGLLESRSRHPARGAADQLLDS
jgi:predicted GTPase